MSYFSLKFWLPDADIPYSRKEQTKGNNMSRQDLFDLADKKGYNLQDHEDGTFSIGTLDDDEDFGLTFDWIAEHMTFEEVQQFLDEN